MLALRTLRIGRRLKSPRCFSSIGGGVDSGVDNGANSDNSDLLITGLNGNQDISVKVVSCRELLQELIIRNDLSPQVAKTLGEVVTCSLMMGSGLKGEETLQVNIVGNGGVGNVMAITDGNLKVRGMVGKARFSTFPPYEDIATRDLFGSDGQIQVVRNHPTWKQPMNGIVSLRDTKISLNMALYMYESEQRTAAIITDVKVEGNLCRHALGVMVERLPGATDENIETSISNLENVEKKGLRSYLDRTDEEREADTSMFRSMERPLNSILDECLRSMDEQNSIRWNKKPHFKCSCGIEKVWRTLRLLPLDEIKYLVSEPEDLQIKCEFCGEVYKVSRRQVQEEIVDKAS